MVRQDTQALRAAIKRWKEEAQGNPEYAQLVAWLTELLHRRGGPWCPGCGSPVVEEGDVCHSCRDGTHNPEDLPWLNREYINQ
jgi:hypothetical protein